MADSSIFNDIFQHCSAENRRSLVSSPDRQSGLSLAPDWSEVFAHQKRGKHVPIPEFTIADFYV